MRTYTIVNDNDANETFEVQANNAEDAAFEALKELGWWVATPDIEPGE